MCNFIPYLYLMTKRWATIPLFFLFAVAVIGTALRGVFILGTRSILRLEFGNVLHAHSHVAFQGWIYPALFLGFVVMFLSPAQIQKGRYKLQLVLTVVTIVGMLITFSLQGYGLYSIAFSTLYQFISYWFIVKFLLDLGHTRQSGEPRPLSHWFAIISLLSLLVATMGPYALAVISAKGGNDTVFYRWAVYFYLHFQYNGGFTFGILALWFRIREQQGIIIPQKAGIWGFGLLAVSLIPGYGLSLIGDPVAGWVYWVSVVAGLMQLVGTVLVFRALFTDKSEQGVGSKLILGVAIGSLTLKTLLQLASVLPAFAELAFHNRNVLIAYIHLCLIGFISFGLLSFFVRRGWLHLRSPFVAGGIVLFFVGFVATELILVLHGTFQMVKWIWGGMFSFSLVMAVGTLAILVGAVLKREPVSTPNLISDVSGDEPHTSTD